MPPRERRIRKCTQNSNQAEEGTSKPSTRSKNSNPEKENSRKRRRSQSPPSGIRTKVKRFDDGKVRDFNCWLCHKIGYEIECESCPRVYHNDCLKKFNHKCNINVKCECKLNSVDGKYEDLEWEPFGLKRMLQYVMDRAIKPEKRGKSSVLKAKFFRHLNTWEAESDNLCKIMDIAILIDSMNGDEPYLNTGQFYMDVKWLYHNYCTFYGIHHELSELAKKFESNIKLELTDMEWCPECYRYKAGDQHGDHFTRVCSTPHDIIWAKLRGSPFWPAKCMHVRNGNVEVRFFGTHDRASIIIKNCFKISKQHPHNKIINKPLYNDAMRELSLYVHNYKDIYGQFECHEINTPLSDPREARKKQKKMGQSNTLNSRPSTTVPEPTDRKMCLPLSCVNNLDENERNQNISENQISEENGVVFHSTFTTHDHSDPINELNNSYELISSSPENFELPQSSLDPAITLPSIDETLIQSTADLTVACTGIVDNSIKCSNQVSSFMLNKESLPVIASTHSSVEIPHDSQLAETNSVNSLPIIASTSSAADRNMHFTSRDISVLNQQGEMQIDEPQTSNQSMIVPSFNEKMQNIITENNLDSSLNEEPEEEIQVISEETKTRSIMKNPAIVKAVAEILLAAKPDIKNQFRQLQEKFLYSYIAMYMDSYYAKFSNSEIDLFMEVVNKFLKKTQFLEKDNAQLRSEVKKSKETLKLLEEEVAKLTKVQDEKNALKDVIIQSASKRFMSENEDSQKHADQNKEMIELMNSLQLKLRSTRGTLEIRQQQLNFLQESQKELKAQLKSYNENLKNVKSVEVQTDTTLLNSEENPPCEFASSESQQPSPSMEYSSNTTTDDETGCEDQETITTSTRRFRAEVVLRRGTVSSSVADNELNVNDHLPQTFEGNGFMNNFQPTLMPPVAPSYIATTASPLLAIIPTTQRQIYINSENSASFFHTAMNSTSSSNNLEDSNKTCMKRKKKNM